MKIAIDISSIIYGTGVSTYTKNLVRNLFKEDKKNDYILFGGSLRRKKELKDFIQSLKGSNFESRILTLPPSLADILWNRLHVLSVEKLVSEIDILHSSDWAQPPSNAFNVTTIHDLVPLKYPKFSLPKIIAVHNRRFKWVKKEVDVVIVPSEATKKDAISFGIEEKRISVIPEAPDPIFKPANKSEIDLVKKKYQIKGEYVISVGVNPRKNTENIVGAVKKLRKTKDFKHFTHVVVGHRYQDTPKTYGILYIGHVDSIDMPRLYSGASALVYPSIYEGFGLPILEAFACNTPVVTSDLGSMKEVAGKAGVLVKPKDVESIYWGLKKAIEERNKLIKLGQIRLKNFSWTKTAKMTLDVYQSVIH